MKVESLVVGLVVLAIVACGGGATPNPPATGSAPAAASPERPATDVPATPTPVTFSPPCEPSALRTDVGGPNGATAMMTLTVIIGNVGKETCSLGRPSSVEFRSVDGALLASGYVIPNSVSRVNIQPSQPPSEVRPNPPGGSAFIWMVWSWKSGASGPCARNTDGVVLVWAEFPEGLRIESEANVILLPCEHSLGFQFGVLPPPD